MSEDLSADRLRAAVTDVVNLVAATTRAEAGAKQALAADSDAADRAYQQAKAAIDERFTTGKKKIADDYQNRRKQIKSDFDSTYASTKKEGEERLAVILAKAKKNEEAATKALQEAVWLAETV